MAPPCIQKCLFTLSLDTPPHLLHSGATRVGGSGPVYHHRTFFSSFSFISPSLKIID